MSKQRYSRFSRFHYTFYVHRLATIPENRELHEFHDSIEYQLAKLIIENNKQHENKVIKVAEKKPVRKVSTKKLIKY